MVEDGLSVIVPSNLGHALQPANNSRTWSRDFIARQTHGKEKNSCGVRGLLFV
jgi:hypothetical protein